MKKTMKPSKKIQLDKQTVRPLSPRELASANGGLVIGLAPAPSSCGSGGHTC
jgi:hypothetical protein